MTRLVANAALLAGCAILAAGQIAPFAPTSPTSSEECQRFQSDVAAYEMAVTKQHQDCLSRNAANRPGVETKDPLTCSRSMCQSFHDLLYGDSWRSVGYLRKEVDSCNSKLAEYLNEKARQQQILSERESREKAERATREKEEIKKEADEKEAREKERREGENANKDAAQRLAARKKEKARDEQNDRASKDIREGQKSDINPQLTKRENAEKTNVVPQPGADQIAMQQQKDVEAPPINATREPSLADPFASQNSKLADPFSKSTTQAELIDPFARSAVVDPFSSEAINRSERGDPSDETQGIRDTSFKLAELGAKTINSRLERNIDVARRSLPSGEFRKYEANARDAEAVTSAFSKTVKFVDYGVDAVKIEEADPGKNTQYHLAETLYKPASELVERVSQEGFQHVVIELFPRAAPYIVRAVDIGAAAGQVLFDSERTTDFHEVIQDDSGRYSVAEKEDALAHLMKAYQTTGSHWPSSDVGRLAEESQKVLIQAEELKQNSQ